MQDLYFRETLVVSFSGMGHNDASHDPSSEWTNLCEVSFV